MKSTKIEKIKSVLLSGAVVTKQGLPILTGTPDSAFTEGLITEGVRKNMMCDYDSSHFAVYYIKPQDLQNLKRA